MLLFRVPVAILLLIALIATAPLWLPFAILVRPPKPKDREFAGAHPSL